MTSLVVCYWFCAACVLYTYIGYPLLVAGVAMTGWLLFQSELACFCQRKLMKITNQLG